jgi:SagB-type dehydrogenase family enzyme
VICLLFCISTITKTEIISAQNSHSIVLPEPNTEGGKSLKQVLKLRHSARQFSTENIPLQTLSDLLWAAWGINREDSGKRTAPSMGNRQTIDVYVATSNGLYLYEAKENTLTEIHEKDIRALIGRQSFVKEAPVNLIYVADLTRMGKIKDEQKMFLSAADAGYISQNVYLFCASEELATVVFHSINTDVLEKEMRLKPEQKIILAQSVGYPQK